MFFQFADDVTTVDFSQIDSHYVTAGYVTPKEFDRISQTLSVSDALQTELVGGESFACYSKKNFSSSLVLTTGIVLSATAC